MTHKMILMSHDFKEVKALVIAKRKVEAERRISSGDRATDSYPVDSGQTPLSGSTSDERE